MVFFTNLPKIEGSIWINSDPIEELEAKVILVDFFTYSCVNCIRTIPHLVQLHKNYKDLGLQIIGVHTPEFEFEKDVENVKKALKKLKINWPVVIDNDNALWQAFGNKYWPTKYIANENKKIVYSHFGEGSYLETENEIRLLLGLDQISKEDFKLDDPLEINFCVKPTPETYLGYYRGKPQQDEELVYDMPYNFARPENLEADRFSLSGQFNLKAEFVESVNFQSSLILSFTATEVNLVVLPVGEECKIKIQLDGQDLTPKQRGKDVDTESYLTVLESRMYNLVKSKEGLTGALTLTPQEGNFRAFAFTFSGCN